MSRRVLLATGSGALLSGLAGCSSGTDVEGPDTATATATPTAAPATSPEPQFSHPDTVPMDHPFSVAIEDVPPGTVELTVTLEDYARNDWETVVTYDTEGGRLALDETAPREEGVAAGTMGLLAGMEPPPIEGPYIPDMREPNALQFSLSRDGETLAESSLLRTYGNDSVTATDLTDVDGFVGTVYEPPGDGPAPPIVAMHGSGANQPHNVARMLATHGYLAIALKYFEWEDADDRIPTGLVHVPLEIPERAIEWLLDHDRAAGDRVGLWGVSKGGELALLAASRLDTVGPVVSMVGSGHIWPGFDTGGAVQQSSWTVDGDPVPFVPYVQDEEAWEGASEGKTTPGYRASFEGASESERTAAAIDMTAIEGPVLLVSGGRDGVWPSELLQRDARERLATAGVTVDHRVYDDAGHAIMVPYRPTTNRKQTPRYYFGGTPAGYAEADAGHWPRVLETFAAMTE